VEKKEPLGNGRGMIDLPGSNSDRNIVVVTDSNITFLKKIPI
jgi:hypothetical protein